MYTAVQACTLRCGAVDQKYEVRIQCPALRVLLRDDGCIRGCDEDCDLVAIRLPGLL